MPIQSKQQPPYYQQGINVKKYIALLNQTGTAAPIPTILENTIGNIVWTRIGTGTYNATLTGQFGLTNTWMSIQIQNEPNFTSSQSISHVDENIVRVATWIADGSEADDILANTSIEIRIYNL